MSIDEIDGIEYDEYRWRMSYPEPDTVSSSTSQAWPGVRLDVIILYKRLLLGSHINDICIISTSTQGCYWYEQPRNDSELVNY